MRRGLLPRLGCVQPPYLHQEAISLRPFLPEVPRAEISALQGTLPSLLCTVPSRCSGFWRRARLSQLANVANVSRGKRGRVWLPAWCRHMGQRTDMKLPHQCPRSQGPGYREALVIREGAGEEGDHQGHQHKAKLSGLEAGFVIHLCMLIIPWNSGKRRFWNFPA